MSTQYKALAQIDSGITEEKLLQPSKKPMTLTITFPLGNVDMNNESYKDISRWKCESLIRNYLSNNPDISVIIVEHHPGNIHELIREFLIGEFYKMTIIVGPMQTDESREEINKFDGRNYSEKYYNWIKSIVI
jgi:hypothetical protein